MWHDASAVGAKELSPALQRWGGVVFEYESRRDGTNQVTSAVPTALPFLTLHTQR